MGVSGDYPDRIRQPDLRTTDKELNPCNEWTNKTEMLTALGDGLGVNVRWTNIPIEDYMKLKDSPDDPDGLWY